MLFPVYSIFIFTIHALYIEAKRASGATRSSPLATLRRALNHSFASAPHYLHGIEGRNNEQELPPPPPCDCLNWLFDRQIRRKANKADWLDGTGGNAVRRSLYFVVVDPFSSPLPIH